MPKRHRENSVDILSKKLRKLEKEIKCIRRMPRRRIQLSETSSSCSSRCSSKSRSSRDSTPIPDKAEDRDILEPTSPAPLSENVTAAAGAVAPPPLAPLPALEPAAIAASTTANSTDVAPPTQAMEHADGEMDPDIIDILGSDPAAIQKYGADINKDLALRLNHMATSGLEKENRKQLIEKYLVPANCSHIGAPRLNAEIKAAVPDTVVKRDKAIESRQTEIAAAISCLGQTISTLLKDKDKDHELLKQLMDSERILCDIQYSESISRRNFALYSLKKDMKEQLANAKIDNFLFGADLPDTLRTAKAITKSSSDFKIEAPKKAKPFTPAA